MTDYIGLDELDIEIEGSRSPRLDDNHKQLLESIELYEFRMAREDMDYRIWRHDFFPYGKKKRRRW